MSEAWQRVNELFHAALERPPGERAAFVAARAGTDEALRAEVLSLIDAHERAGADFLESPARADEPDAGGDSPVGSDAPVHSAGDRIGPYVIERELGRGGMGVVYLAEDERLRRKVALKALPPSYSRDRTRRERLRKEARAAARLSHGSIATVYALEEIDGDLFIASEYVAGRTLREELSRGPMPVQRIVRVMTQVAGALAAAHDDGVVHRDLKPENVVCDERGGAKILDFGVARSLATGDRPGTRLTEAGVMVGTPAYMSPEQIEDGDVSPRSDIFSFGIVLYELATGIHPFEGTSAASTIARILTVDPSPPGQLCAVPPAFDRIVRKCLHKRPEDRYQSATELAADLERVEPDGGSEVRRPTSDVRASSGSAPLGRSEGRVREANADAQRYPTADAGPRTMPAAAGRAASPYWWRVHQRSVVGLYAVMTAIAWVASEWIQRDWAVVVFFVCVAAAALNGTLRVHLLFTERHNAPAFRGELARSTPWLRASDAVLGLALMTLAVAVARAHVSVAIVLAAVGAGAIIVSVAVEPATTDAAFPRRPSGVRRRPSGQKGRSR